MVSNGRTIPAATVASSRIGHYTDAAESIFDVTVEVKSWRATEAGNPRSRRSARAAFNPLFVAFPICDLNRNPWSSITPRILTSDAGAIIALFTCNGSEGSWRCCWFLVKWMNDVFSASKTVLDCAAHSNARGMTFRCSTAVFSSADEPTV